MQIKIKGLGSKKPLKDLLGKYVAGRLREHLYSVYGVQNVIVPCRGIWNGVDWDVEATINGVTQVIQVS